MPREFIYTEHKAIESNMPVAPQMCVSVGWSKEDHGGHVQLATLRNGKENSFDPTDGLYTDLNRKQINDLIKALRKARDQAYGKDE